MAAVVYTLKCASESHIKVCALPCMHFVGHGNKLIIGHVTCFSLAHCAVIYANKSVQILWPEQGQRPLILHILIITIVFIKEAAH